MERVARVLLFLLVSATYWIAAALTILFAGWAIPGDCGTERTVQGMRECSRDVRTVVIVGAAMAALLYGAIVWRFARRP
jgi:hypothetical protein